MQRYTNTHLHYKCTKTGSRMQGDLHPHDPSACPRFARWTRKRSTQRVLFFLVLHERMVRSVGLLSVFWTLCGSQVRLLVE